MDQAEHDPTGLGATLAERGKRYGRFMDHARVTQLLKDVAYNQLTAREVRMLPDQREALDMIFHKIGRIVCGDPNYADSWHDIAGYAKLVEDRLNGKSELGVAKTEAAISEWRNDRQPTKEDADNHDSVWVWDNTVKMALKAHWCVWRNRSWMNGNAPRPTHPPAFTHTPTEG